MRSRAFEILMVAVAVSSLTGCGDLPVVGSLGDSLSGVAAPVMGLLDPILGHFFPKNDSPPAAPAAPAPVRPHRRNVRAAQGQGSLPAGATESASASVDPKVVFATWSERNKKFDRLRTAGLLFLYNGQTAAALDSFKQAQTLRPEDPQINHLVALCEHPQTFMSKDQLHAMAGVDTSGIPQGAVPVQPPSVPAPDQAPAANAGTPVNAAALKGIGQLLKGANQGGDKPGGLF